MSKCAVVVGRNDNYGGSLAHRAEMCLLSLSKVFDHVVYVDWKMIDVPLTDVISSKFDNVTTITITEDIIEKNWPQYINYPMVETVARNIGIRHAIDNNLGDWICSTNIDVVMSEFSTEQLDKDTLYTSRRYNIPRDFHIDLSEQDKQNAVSIFKAHKNQFNRAQMSVVDGRGVWDAGDHWSLVVCCGDFQLAHKDLWSEIRGFEQAMGGRCYADSNLMKRPILIGKHTAIFDEVLVFHLDHTNESFRKPGEHLPLNDQKKYVADWCISSNTISWGTYNA